LEIFFGVNSRNPIEIEVIKEVKPDNIMLSYYYWRNKSLYHLVEKIEYKPTIMLDSGGFSGFVDTEKYIDYIKEHLGIIDHYLSPDYLPCGRDISAERTSHKYILFEDYGLPLPIPVYHYGEKKEILECYIYGFGQNYIALGNTVGTLHYSKVKDWVNKITFKYNADFHLLGSTGRTIINNCPLLKSCDSTTWIQQAKRFGKPEHINNVKDRAIFQMEMIKKEYPVKYIQKLKYHHYEKTLFG